jgi:hypothetical protein
MKRILVILILIATTLNAEEIPQDRLVDWSKAGADEMPVFSHIITASSLGLDATGQRDNTAAVNNAIDTAAKPLMILFEPGVYLFSGTIMLKNDICISGYSSQNTFFKFDMRKKSLRCISANGTAGSQFTDVSGGYFRGSGFLLTSESSLFNIDDYIELRQENGTWDSNPADWAKNSVGQILQISNINGDTIFFHEKLRINYSPTLHPQIRRINPVKNCEIKYMNIERIDLPETGAPYNILFSLAVNCVVRGLESNKSVGSHVMITLSKNITVSGCYFHHAFIFDGSGTKGYGVTLNNHTSDCLVENNIFKYLRHAMMVKHGANGNVFACNYSLEPNRSEPVANLSGDISLHGHFAYANLFEGNIVQNIITDDYWGPSGPLNTFFRNRAELYGIISTSDKSDTMNYAGNETTNSAPFMGQFMMKGSGHYLYGNNIIGTTTPAGTDDFSQKSIFYKDTPQFWDINAPFPSIGLPNDLGKYTIPAKYRYEHKDKKTVGEYIPVSVDRYDYTEIRITPNPSTDYIEIIASSLALWERARVRVYILLGNVVVDTPPGPLLIEGERIRLDVSGLAKGVYFVRVGGRMLKFVKL